MDVQSAFEAWSGKLSQAWWDDAGDAGGILDSMQDAFEAGWLACSAETVLALRALAGGMADVIPPVS